MQLNTLNENTLQHSFIISNNAMSFILTKISAIPQKSGTNNGWTGDKAVHTIVVFLHSRSMRRNPAHNPAVLF